MMVPERMVGGKERAEWRAELLAKSEVSTAQEADLAGLRAACAELSAAGHAVQLRENYGNARKFLDAAATHFLTCVRCRGR